MFSLERHFDHVIDRRANEFIAPELIFRCNPQTVKILIVADGSISFGTAGFGLGDVIATLREPKYSYVRFEVTMATREGSAAEISNPSDTEATYTGFRFNRTESDGSPTLHKYNQVWLFGINPNSTFDESNFSDANITDSSNNHLSQVELATLTRWMNTQHGGVFATGDHHILGASMCAEIPRVGTMRRWTINQNAPSVSNSTRHSTLRPATPGQTALTSSLQSDAVPQPLQLKQYPLRRSVLERSRSQPHPLLCDPEHGSINIFPDHQHEGWIIEDHQVQVDEQYDFGNDVTGSKADGDEYPTVGSNKPVPEVIAWANTLGSPTYTHDGTSLAAKHFGVIGVYDGNPASVGRVVVDSTWHHWFNVNLTGLKADTSTNYYERIQTFFRNVGIWLATPSQRSSMLVAASWNATFTIDALQNWNLSLANHLLGQKARDVIGREVSGCLMRDFLHTWVLIPELIPRFPELERLPDIDPLCLSCPPEDFIEDVSLGGLIREILPRQNEQMLDKLNGKSVRVNSRSLNKAAREGVLNGVNSFVQDFELSVNAAMNQFDKMKIKLSELQ